MYFGLGRDKYYCVPCDYVAKAKHTPACPTCREPMTWMGDKWRPGKRGTKTRLWDDRDTLQRQEAARIRDKGWGTLRWVPYSGTTKEWVQERTRRGEIVTDRERKK